MKYNKVQYILLIVFLGMLASFDLQAAEYNGDMFTLISIPKSGTHLIIKYLHILTKKKARWTGTPFPEEEKYINILYEAWKHGNAFSVCHLLHSSKNELLLGKNNIKLFFMIRDPRDQVVSFANYARVLGTWAENLNLTIDQIIDQLIDSDSFYKKYWSGIVGVDQLYRAFLPWMDTKNVCVVRFEDLVGPQGGGSLKAQLGTLKNMANHLGIYPTDRMLLSNASELFGKTFYKGQIGSWKSTFSEHHKDKFKRFAGQLLIDLEYEKDFNW